MGFILPPNEERLRLKSGRHEQAGFGPNGIRTRVRALRGLRRAHIVHGGSLRNRRDAKRDGHAEARRREAYLN